MILHCNFEELTALKEGARLVLEDSVDEDSSVAAPPVERSRVEDLVGRLDGSFEVETLSELQALQAALVTIVDVLRADMELAVVTRHPAEETAVAAYFDFGHALSVLSRVEEMGAEMRAVIEVVTGRKVTEELARTFVFPN